MSKQLLVRISSEDLRKLDLLADSIGGGSRAAGIRFLIRQWFDQKKSYHRDIQSISGGTPA